MRALPSSTLSLLVLASGAAAQGQVWVVDDDGGPGVAFTDVQAAVDAASDGDLVLVRPGAYAGFSIVAKGLAVVGDLGADVFVSGGCVVSGLAASQTVELRALDIASTASVPALRLDSNMGSVWIEDVDVAQLGPGGSASLGAVDVAGCAGVTLQRCTVAVAIPSSPAVGNGGMHGVRVASSSVFLHLVTATGGKGKPGSTDSTIGGAGLLVASGSAFLYGGVFRGGEGATGEDLGEFLFCDNGSPGGFGLWLEPGAQVTRLGARFEGGPGGPGGTDPFSGFACAAGPDGPALQIFAGAIDVELAGSVQAWRVDSPVRGGQPATLVVDGLPSTPVFALASVGTSFAVFPSLAGASCVDPAALVVLLVGATDANGVLQLSLPMPHPAPGFGFVRVFTQALLFDASLGPRLGSGSTLHVLHAAY